MTVPRVKYRTPESFWERLDRSGECWTWTGSRMASGYGHLHWNGKDISAHRLAYTLTHGEIPKGMHVCHRCDNPPCARPDHLFLGTPKQNMQDRDQKGRGARRLKLNSDVVVEVRSLYQGGVSAEQIAERFSVSPGPVYEILRGRGVTSPSSPSATRLLPPKSSRLYIQWLHRQGYLIRRMARQGAPRREIAAMLGVGLTSVDRIIVAHTWGVAA